MSDERMLEKPLPVSPKKKRKRLRKSSHATAEESPKRQKASSPSLFSSDEEDERQPPPQLLPIAVQPEEEEEDLLPPVDGIEAAPQKQVKIDTILQPVEKKQPGPEEEEDELRALMRAPRDPESETCERWRAPPGLRLLVGSVAKVLWTGENGLCKVMLTTERWGEDPFKGWAAAKQERVKQREVDQQAMQHRIEQAALRDIERRLLEGESREQIAANPTPDHELAVEYTPPPSPVPEEEEEAPVDDPLVQGVFTPPVLEYLRLLVLGADLQRLTTGQVRKRLEEQFADVDFVSHRKQLKRTLRALVNEAQQKKPSPPPRKEKRRKDDEPKKRAKTGKMVPVFGRLGSTSAFVRYALHVDALGNVKRVLRAKLLFVARDQDARLGRHPTREQVSHRATKLGVYENSWNKHALSTELTGPLKRAGCKTPSSVVCKNHVRHVKGRAMTFFGNIFALRSELEVLMGCLVGPRKLTSLMMTHGYEALVRDPLRIFFARETALEVKLEAAIETLTHARNPAKELMFEQPEPEQMHDLQLAHKFFADACRSLRFFGSSLTPILSEPPPPAAADGDAPLPGSQEGSRYLAAPRHTEQELRRAVAILSERYACMMQVRHKASEPSDGDPAGGRSLIARLMFQEELELEVQLWERITRMAMQHSKRYRAHFEPPEAMAPEEEEEEEEDEEEEEGPSAVVRRVLELLEQHALCVLDVGLGRMREVVSALIDRHPEDFLATATYVSDCDASLPIVPLHRFVCENPDDEDRHASVRVRALLVLGAESLGLRALHLLLKRFTRLRYLWLAGDSRHRRPCGVGDDHGHPFLDLVRSKRLDDSGAYCVRKLEDALPRRGDPCVELFDTYLRDTFGSTSVSTVPLGLRIAPDLLVQDEARLLVKPKREARNFALACTPAHTFQCLANNAEECRRLQHQVCGKQERRFQVNDVVVVRGAKAPLSASSSAGLHAFRADDDTTGAGSAEGITGVIVSFELFVADRDADGQPSQPKSFCVPLGRGNRVKLRLADLDNGDNVGDRRLERELSLAHAGGWTMYHATCVTVRTRPSLVSRRVDTSGIWVSPTTRWHDVYAALLRARERFVIFCDAPTELRDALLKGTQDSRTLFGCLVSPRGK